MSTVFQEGAVVDNQYQILQKLAEGGMGAVYKAREVRLNRVVAIKVLHPEFIWRQDSVKRFMREGRVLATLSHPHIMSLYRFGIWQKEYPYIAMEYIEGRSLYQVLESGESLGIKRILMIAMQVCDAMECAHAHGIVHRDITPNNIMLLQDRQDFVKIIDFGLSSFKNRGAGGETLTASGVVLGTAYYMSPEQCMGAKADARSDIYSLACVLYYLITGRTVFDGENVVGLMHKHVSAEPEAMQPLSGETLPPGLELVIRRALAKQPSERQASMAKLKEELELVAAGKPHLIESTTNSRDSIKQMSKVTKVVAACICSGLLLFLIAAGKELWVNRLAAAVPGRTPADRSPMRRLRSKDSLSKCDVAETTKYYQNWLACYGSERSADSAEAQLELAGCLQATDPTTADKLRRSALATVRSLLQGAIQKRDAQAVSTCITQMVNIRKAFNEEQELEADLHTCVWRLEQAQLIGQAAVCRLSLASHYGNAGQHKEALVQLSAVRSKYPATAVEHLRATVMTVRCLKGCGRASEALDAARAAAAYAHLVKGAPDAQEDLIASLTELGDSAAALRLLNAIAATSAQSLSRSVCILYRIRALSNLRRIDEALSCLAAAREEEIPLSELVKSWGILTVAVLRHDTAQIGSLVDLFAQLACKPLNEAEACSVINTLIEVVRTARQMQQANAAEKLLGCTNHLLPEYFSADKPVAAQAISELIIEYQFLGKPQLYEATLDRLLQIATGKPGFSLLVRTNLELQKCELLLRSRRHPESLALCEQMIARITAQPEPYQELKIRCLILKTALVNDRAQGVLTAQEAVRLADQLDSTILAVNSRLALGRAYEVCNNYGAAEECFQQASLRARRLTGRQIWAKQLALYSLAALYFNNGKQSKCEPVLRQLIEMNGPSPNLHKRANAMLTDMQKHPRSSEKRSTHRTDNRSSSGL